MQADITLPEPITYTKNGGVETAITATTSIAVAAGDEVCFFSRYADMAVELEWHSLQMDGHGKHGINGSVQTKSAGL